MLAKSQVKYIQSLGQKKFRSQELVFVAEGPKLVGELLQAHNVKAKAIFATEHWTQNNAKILGRLPGDGRFEVTTSELERLTFLATPNQVLGLFHFPTFEADNSSDKLSLALDEIQDPGNLGTLIRVADWFGVDRIYCSENSADAFNPKVVQSSMGSIARVQVTYGDLPDILRQCQTPIIASMLEGKSLYTLEPMRKGILLIGNESRGIAPELTSFATHIVTIPRIGQAESLNASVAAGVLLFQLTRTI